MIECQKVSKSYGNQLALDGIDLVIKDGEFIAIMGPSGSGKTTLLNILAGIDRPSNGHVFLDKHDLTTLSSKQIDNLRQDVMGFIFQEYHVLNSLSVLENIALPLTIKRMKKQEIIVKVKEIADDLGLSEHLEKYPYQLSGGQKQRVAIARALITNPVLLFADEPTGALDSKNAHYLLKSLQEQNIKKGLTLILVTHDAFSASFAQRVIFLKDGKIYNSLSRDNDDRKNFYEQIIQVSMNLGGDFDAE